MDMNAQILTVTDAAIAQLKKLMAENEPGALGIRVGVSNGGCSGMRYTMDFTTEKDPMDQAIDAGGITVLVDPMATMYLAGTEMDYVQQDLAATFVFRNPNETSRCGCGESFSV